MTPQLRGLDAHSEDQSLVPRIPSTMSDQMLPRVTAASGNQQRLLTSRGICP